MDSSSFGDAIGRMMLRLVLVGVSFGIALALGGFYLVPWLVHHIRWVK